jgi:tryptophanyl-tRNA synthetase
LFTIIKACGQTGAWDELYGHYQSGTLKYSDLKNVAADSLVVTLKPFRERRAELNGNRQHAKKLMHDLSAAARDLATRVLDDVKELTGLIR